MQSTILRAVTPIKIPIHLCVQLHEKVLAILNEVICEADLGFETFPTPRLHSPSSFFSWLSFNSADVMLIFVFIIIIITLIIKLKERKMNSSCRLVCFSTLISRLYSGSLFYIKLQSMCVTEKQQMWLLYQA